MNAPVLTFWENGMDNYKLANIIVQWDGGGFELAKGNYMERFRCGAVDEIELIHLRGRFVALEAYTRFPIKTENSTYALFDIYGERLLIYHWGHCRFAFAIWPDRIRADRTNECWFDPDMIHQPQLNADWFFGVSGLHKALLMRGAAIIHASYVEKNGQGILFTAPSGTGKSTQASLWNSYIGANIVNGDRVLVRKWKECWQGFGYPCCGSSRICLNKAFPLRAIVAIQQGEKNHIEEMSASQKIRTLAAAIEVYPWDTEEIQRALDIAESLAEEVSVVHLICRPDQEAVEVLSHYLEVEDYATGI